MANLKQSPLDTLGRAPTLDDLASAMNQGWAVTLSDAELDGLLAMGLEVRTAHKLTRVSVKERPWVGWLSGTLSTWPPCFKIDNDHKAKAEPGPCVYAKTGNALPDDWHPATH